MAFHRSLQLLANNRTTKVAAQNDKDKATKTFKKSLIIMELAR
jgi:hypothetical protein